MTTAHIIWNVAGLVVGTGLIFVTDFKTRSDHVVKTMGVLMVVLATYRLSSLIV